MGPDTGSSYTAGDAAYHAFLSDGTTMYDLNNLLAAGSGWMLDLALGINNAGQITGSGLINGQRYAFLMTLNALTSVPKPASFALLGLGLLELGFIRKAPTAG